MELPLQPHQAQSTRLAQRHFHLHIKLTEATCPVQFWVCPCGRSSWPSHGGILLEGAPSPEEMLWPTNRHVPGRLLHPSSIGCAGMIHLHSPNPLKMFCSEEARLCPLPKSKKQMLSCISEAHAAEPGLKSASFWPESEPVSLVFSYFCLAGSISEVKDIQGPDSLPTGSILDPQNC